MPSESGTQRLLLFSDNAAIEQRIVNLYCDESFRWDEINCLQTSNAKHLILKSICYDLSFGPKSALFLSNT